MNHLAMFHVIVVFRTLVATGSERSGQGWANAMDLLQRKRASLSNLRHQTDCLNELGFRADHSGAGEFTNLLDFYFQSPLSHGTWNVVDHSFQWNSH
jgi:hypothetical protein